MIGSAGQNKGGEFWLWHTSDHPWWHSAWSHAYLRLPGFLRFRRLDCTFGWDGMPNRQSIWCL